MKFITIILTAFSLTVAKTLDEFPLWGSSWVVAQGANKKIFPSILPLRPNKIAHLTFHSDKSVTIYYANLDHRTYTCSALLLDDIKNQLENNYVRVSCDSIKMGRYIDIAYQPYNDTVWSGDYAVSQFLSSSKYPYIGRIVENTDSLFNTGDYDKLRNTPVYFRDKPIYYGVRFATPEDKQKYNIESVNDDESIIYFYNDSYMKDDENDDISQRRDLATTDLSGLEEETPFSNFRKGDTIYEYIPVKYKFKTANVGYWQVHVHPEVWYYPRDPFDGTPFLFDTLKITKEEADKKKKESIDLPDDLNLKYYRNPYLSDSASVIISFAFINKPGVNLKEQTYIDLTDSIVNITHYPSKMYQTATSYDWQTYKTSIYKLYSVGELDEKMNAEIDTRCSSWETIDIANSKIIFPEKLQMHEKLVRDRSVDDGIYTYNDCPCSKIPELKNLTPVQLQRFLFMSPPMCDRTEMKATIEIYKTMMRYLTKPSDKITLQKKKFFLEGLIAEGDKRAKEAGVDWTKPNKGCPKTWIKHFLNQ